MFKDLTGKKVEVVVALYSGNDCGPIVYQGTIINVGPDEDYLELDITNANPLFGGRGTGLYIGNLTKTGHIRIRTDYIISVLEL
jgi:hypothetical protein